MAKMNPEQKKGVIEEIANGLRARVLAGEFGSNGRLPTATQLSRQFSHARSTIYDAYHILVLEGVVVQRGNGYFPNHQRQIINGITPTFDGYLRQHGMTPKQENLIEPELIAMPDEIANMFGQPKGVHVVHRLRLQGTIQMPLRIAEIWYPATLAEPFLAQMQADPNMDVLSAIKGSTGMYIEPVEEVVIARIPTAEEASLLMIPRTAPVFELRRWNFTPSGHLVMLNRIIMIGTFFELSYRYTTHNWSSTANAVKERIESLIRDLQMAVNTRAVGDPLISEMTHKLEALGATVTVDGKIVSVTY